MAAFLRLLGRVSASVLDGGRAELCPATAADFDARLRSAEGVAPERFLASAYAGPRCSRPCGSAAPPRTRRGRGWPWGLMMEASADFLAVVRACEVAGSDRRMQVSGAREGMRIGNG
jgi:hypothetical protein